MTYVLMNMGYLFTVCSPPQVSELNLQTCVNKLMRGSI